MKLWIDDMRDAPDESWTVARKVQPAISAICIFEPHTISIDHDIDFRPDDETFQPVAHYIGQKCKADKAFADGLTIRIHSDNPTGAKNIQNILSMYGVNDVPWEPYTTNAAFKEKYGLE